MKQYYIVFRQIWKLLLTESMEGNRLILNWKQSQCYWLDKNGLLANLLDTCCYILHSTCKFTLKSI